MAAFLLNLDGGEHDDEPIELYRLADVVHVACGGHAGDDASMARVVRACLAAGTGVGAHPSYVDREGFGRRARHVAPADLAHAVEAQCSALRRVADAHGARVTSAKPHGALYHRAHADTATAEACVSAICRALGPVAIVGLADGALELAARAANVPYLREVFADRGVREDGTLIPRDEPGAVVDDPVLAAARTASLIARGDAETLCVHADTTSALAIARAVRRVLDAP